LLKLLNDVPEYVLFNLYRTAFNLILVPKLRCLH